MRRIMISFAVMLCVLFAGSITAYAGSNVIDGLDTVNEDLAPDKELIYEDAEKRLYDKFEECVYISEEDIEYGKAAKFYTSMWNTDLLKDTELSYDKFQECLSKAKYYYYIPVYHNNETAILTISIGLEIDNDVRNSGCLEPEDIEKLERVKGRWHISCIEIRPYNFDYISHIESLLGQNNIENAEVYLLGGIGFGLNEVAVIFSDRNSEPQFLILGGFDENDNLISAEQPSAKLYSYAEIKKMVEENEQTTVPGETVYIGYENSVSSEKMKNILICSAAAVAVLAAAVIIFKAKKKAKSIEEQAQ